MKTAELVEHLARDLRPVPRDAVARRLLVGVLGGGLVTLAIVMAGLGIRADLAVAAHRSALWLKACYALALAVGAIATAARLARPEAARLATFWPLSLPVLVLSTIAGVELWLAPAADRWAMWFGHTWKVCPWLVLGLSGPIFIGLILSVRRLAPTQLRGAGAAIGLSAGAVAATLYCLHCPETSALFVLSWYTLGMVLASAIGAVAGPRLLRW